MIGLSTSMKALLGAKYEQTAVAKKVMWVMGGTMPTKAQIAALVQADGSISSNALKALGTLRLSVAYPATVVPLRTGVNLVSWLLSQRGETFTVNAPGIADWFVFMYVQTNINEPNYTTDAKIYQCFIGRVGDIGETGVDMELLGAMIESDKLYKTTDFEIKSV
jgi:hypothetical protein